MMMAGVPADIDAAKVGQFLQQQPGVSDVHDLHIWSMSTTETALTAHLVMPDGYPGDTVIDEINLQLQRQFAIAHCTLQVELGTTSHTCSLQDQAET
jgi:cobalt-zinc-cadmium efflux system protein